MELLEWRSQRLGRGNEDKPSGKSLYKTGVADRITYTDNLSGFGIKKATEDGGE